LDRDVGMRRRNLTGHNEHNERDHRGDDGGDDHTLMEVGWHGQHLAPASDAAGVTTTGARGVGPIVGAADAGAMIRPVPRTVRVVLLTVATAFALVMNAAPAWAHGVSGLQPTNYRTTVRGLTTAISGVHVRAVDLGGKLELTNTTSTDVVVLGYEQEPYLRIGPRGVFENTWSPAVILNRTTTPGRPAPRAHDPNAAPNWRQVSTGTSASWHDHRAHWMSQSPPPEVSRDSSHRHVVIKNWQVPLTYGTRTANVTGDVSWIPGPSPWPWAAGALGIAAVVIVGARTRRWPVVLAVALALLVGGEAAHIGGLWGASTASTLSKTGSSLYSLAGCLVGLGALVMLVRRDAHDATPVVLIASVFLLISGGLADVTSLTRSQLPSTLPDTVARGVVTAAIGLGAGLVIGTASRLRRPGAEHARPRARGQGQEPSRRGSGGHADKSSGERPVQSTM
jgi:hypothetical protein